MAHLHEKIQNGIVKIVNSFPECVLKVSNDKKELSYKLMVGYIPT